MYDESINNLMKKARPWVDLYKCEKCGMQFKLRSKYLLHNDKCNISN